MEESPNKRILIVDNDEQESNKLEAMVQHAGYDPITTWSGLEALELLKSQKVDIVPLENPDLCKRMGIILLS
jgi:DNA-binding response OmpR family regulator